MNTVVIFSVHALSYVVSLYCVHPKPDSHICFRKKTKIHVTRSRKNLELEKTTKFHVNLC